MNQEINSKIKLISEMMSMYQNTVSKENDIETLRIISKDVVNKRLELENIKNELDAELNKLYDNGANEIDPEVNQLQIVINEVDELIEDVVPDILSYIKFTSGNYNVEKVAPIESEKSVENIEEKVVINPIIIEEKESILINENITNEEKNEENINNIEKIEDLENLENKNIKKQEDEAKNDIEEIENSVTLIENNSQNDDLENKREETEKNDKNENIIVLEEISEEDSNTIKIKQPDEIFRNVASNIVLNRFKNLDSPENAMQKAHNAAENVMNNIIETWKNNNN